MAEPLDSRIQGLGSDDLLAMVVDRRWFAAGEREPRRLRIVGSVELPGDPPAAIAVVEVAYQGGTHDLYALVLAVTDVGVVEALDDPSVARRVAEAAGVRTPGDRVMSMGVEQSNSSIVLDARHVLKLYRRLEAGPNPELEMLRNLSLHGFPNVPLLEGWLQHDSPPVETTLVVVTGFVPSTGAAWELGLESLLHDDGRWLPDRAHRLGEVTGALHVALASDSGDPHFQPEEASAEWAPLLAASLDEEIERLFVELPSTVGALEPILGRSGDLRDLVAGLSHTGPAGLLIRIHGDYHLGQVLWTAEDDWVVIDFEGEPRRPLPERRRRQSPLRDVAGMTRSFAYLADAAWLLRNVDVPLGWEEECRTSFLAGYRDSVDLSLLPTSAVGAARLLTLFEVEKLVYDLRYELAHRPDWVEIPVAGLVRLLEEGE